MQSELKACPFCGSAAEIYYPFHMVGNSRQSATYRGGVRCTKCWCQGNATNPPNEAIAAWNTRAEGDARDAARYRGIRHAMANSDEHFLELLEQHLSQRGLLDHKLLSETEIDSAFDAALKASTGEGND